LLDNTLILCNQRKPSNLPVTRNVLINPCCVKKKGIFGRTHMTTESQTNIIKIISTLSTIIFQDVLFSSQLL